MIQLFRTWAVIYTLFVVATAAAQTRVAPAPWVKPIPADPNLNPGHEAKGGIVYLLIDVQANVEEHATYYHYAYRVVNSEGIQNMADISVDYDPSYEKMYFHTLLMHRDGKTTNLLPSHRFETYRNETDAERFLYNGTVTSTLHLKDVRVGDLLEFSYSIKGRHPATGSKFARTQRLDYSIPVAHRYFSVLTPASRPLHVSYNITDKPTHRTDTEGPHTRYSWDDKNLSPVKEYDDVPAWYSPYLTVTLTEYNNWAEVAQWALPMYETTPAQLEEVKRLYGKTINPRDEESVLDAIHFVQDEIRYLGFEMGMGGFRPNSPEKVFANRFGDCKDKAMLLVALLRSGGIEAYPVLVNSAKTLRLPMEAPSPYAFDHCVVFMRVRGVEYYVDPTISLQGGSLHRLAFPRYHYGLILRRGESRLNGIPHDQRPTVTVREYFTLDTKNGPTDYKVVTEYDHSEADRMRAYIAAAGVDELSKSYLEYYQSLYSDMEPVEEPQVTDDGRNSDNKLTISEHYSIRHGLWDDDGERLQATFSPSLIQGYLTALGPSKRSVPYDLGGPMEIIQEIEVRLPYDWPDDYAEFEISDPAFKYSVHVFVAGNIASITYNYTLLQETVEPEAFADFHKKRTEVSEHISYTLDSGRFPSYKEGPRGKDGLVLALAILGGGGFFAFCIVIAIVVFVYYDPAPKPSPENHAGIGGGLVAVAIGVVLNPLFYFVDIILSMVFMTNSADTDTPGILLLRFLSFGTDIFLFSLSLLLLVNFFMRRTATRTLFLLMFIVWVLAAALNISLAGLTDRSSMFYTKEVFRILFTCALWLPFFILGDQVRGTFTKQLNPPKPDYVPRHPQNHPGPGVP